MISTKNRSLYLIMWVLTFFLEPIPSLIFYLIFNDNYELRNEALKCFNSTLFAAIIGICFSFLVFPILYAIFINIRGLIYGLKSQSFEERYVIRIFSRNAQ